MYPQTAGGKSCTMQNFLSLFDAPEHLGLQRSPIRQAGRQTGRRWFGGAAESHLCRQLTHLRFGKTMFCQRADYSQLSDCSNSWAVSLEIIRIRSINHRIVPVLLCKVNRLGKQLLFAVIAAIHAILYHLGTGQLVNLQHLVPDAQLCGDFLCFHQVCLWVQYRCEGDCRNLLQWQLRRFCRLTAGMEQHGAVHSRRKCHADSLFE